MQPGRQLVAVVVRGPAGFVLTRFGPVAISLPAFRGQSTTTTTATGGPRGGLAAPRPTRRGPSVRQGGTYGHSARDRVDESGRGQPGAGRLQVLFALQRQQGGR